MWSEEDFRLDIVMTTVIETDTTGTPPIRTYKRRWLILFIFMVYSMTNSWQWIQFSIISNIIAKYYDVSTLFVDWTSIIFFLAYIPTILPASVFMDKKVSRIYLKTLVSSILNLMSFLLYVYFLGNSNFSIIILSHY